MSGCLARTFMAPFSVLSKFVSYFRQMGLLLKLTILSGGIGVIFIAAVILLFKFAHSSRVLIATTVIVGVIYWHVCTALSFFWVKRFRKRASQSEELSLTETRFFKGCRLFSYKELQDATRDFSEENKLGKGGFGVVYKGTFSDGSKVAIKQLSQGSEQGDEEFMTEVATIIAIQQKNLVKLKGCCSQGKARLLVYEYLENKSLDLALFGTSTMHVLDWKTRCNIASGIARGLEYLHEQSEPRIIHRDIKASNILLDKDFQPKISDFGLARFLPNDQSCIETERMAGTLGYLSPEAVTGYITEKVDVFAFGVLLLETVSGRKKNDTPPQIETHYIVDWASQLCEEGRPLELIDHKLDGNYVQNEAVNLISTAMLCVNTLASLRPKMSDIVSMLDLSTRNWQALTNQCSYDELV